MEKDEITQSSISKVKILSKKLIDNSGIREPPISLRTVIDYLQKNHKLSILPHGFPEKVDGILISEEDNHTIGFNKYKHWHRKRFTIAHEIGHLQLGHTCSDTPENKHNEFEAQLFAAELLMPAHMLKNDITSGQNVAELHKKYIVSKHALWIKLKQDRLLKYL